MIFPPGSLGVLKFFVIPVGGGIPSGVLLARERGIGWPTMTVLYFISDLILACAFEPVMLLIIAGARRVPALARVKDLLRQVLRQTTAHYGSTGGPFVLVTIAFGVDPMTGRAAAAAAGHGFFSGWTFAIAGDMLFFFLIMASTLWLNSIIGDANKTVAVVLAAMIFLPPLIRRWREGRAK